VHSRAGGEQKKAEELVTASGNLPVFIVPLNLDYAQPQAVLFKNHSCMWFVRIKQAQSIVSLAEQRVLIPEP
jgi:hypothetical protein